MTKKITTITLLIFAIIFISLLVVSTTYSVIIEVMDREGSSEIISDITLRDLVTDDNGMYNSTYYDVVAELDITSDEADILMESVSLNKVLDTLLNSVVDYSLHNKSKLSNGEIYNLIITGVYDDNNINESLRNKVINKTGEYIGDISKYLYDIKTVNYGESA